MLGPAIVDLATAMAAVVAATVSALIPMQQDRTQPSRRTQGGERQGTRPGSRIRETQADLISRGERTPQYANPHSDNGVSTPHVHEQGCGVRPAQPGELPK